MPRKNNLFFWRKKSCAQGRTLLKRHTFGLVSACLGKALVQLLTVFFFFFFFEMAPKPNPPTVTVQVFQNTSFLANPPSEKHEPSGGLLPGVELLSVRFADFLVPFAKPTLFLHSVAKWRLLPAVTFPWPGELVVLRGQVSYVGQRVFRTHLARTYTPMLCIRLAILLRGSWVVPPQEHCLLPRELRDLCAILGPFHGPVWKRCPCRFVFRIACGVCPLGASSISGTCDAFRATEGRSQFRSTSHSRGD